MVLKYKISLLLTLLIIGLFGTARGQIEKATFGVNGLTCSQCSRSVKMQLIKLPFVKKVDMNLAQTSGTLYFKEETEVKVGAIAQAIEDAGFSTRFVYITFNFSKINPGKTCFKLYQSTFYFLKPLPENHSAEMTFQIIAHNFLPRRKLKHYQLNPKGQCTGKRKYYLKVVKG